MSFLTETFDEFRAYPIRGTKIFRDRHYPSFGEKWLDPNLGGGEKPMSDAEKKEFIKSVLSSLRGRSTYGNDYCAHWPPEYRKRLVKPPDPKKKKHSEVAGDEKKERASLRLPPKLNLKDTEIIRAAKALYERDMLQPTLRPLPTQFTVFGYSRQHLFRTGTSEYQESIARLAYTLVSRDAWPKFFAHQGGRTKYGYDQDNRQPMLDVAPYEGESPY